MGEKKSGDNLWGGLLFNRLTTGWMGLEPTAEAAAPARRDVLTGPLAFLVVKPWFAFRMQRQLHRVDVTPFDLLSPSCCSLGSGRSGRKLPDGGERAQVQVGMHVSSAAGDAWKPIYRSTLPCIPRPRSGFVGFSPPRPSTFIH
jgi:hypothetical protein